MPFAPDHETFRDSVRTFVEREIAPHVNAWDEAGSFPRSLYRRAAEMGLLGLGYPESLGGTPADGWYRLVATEEIARAGSGGLMASLFSHSIGLPPIVAHGSQALQRRIVPEVLAGEKIAALAITEPGGGSDVARLCTKARRDGQEWVIDGEKTFITSGMRADWITLAVRTGGPGAAGISLVVVPGDTPGLTRSPLAKMGWWCSDTAQLRFDGVRVPLDHLLGDEGAGFHMIMQNFNGERLLMSAGAVAFAQVCLDEALDWARQRKTFGASLVEHQVIRHKLMDMRMRIASARAWLHALVERQEAGDTGPEWVADLCLLKNHATQTMQHAADQAVQILGGMGFMRGTKCERIYREAKVMMIGGGAEEIMKELAARQLGL
ncbi:acyl-CoA dehydrogenase family protein [Piscinibacter sp.]|uniref:acyl-CoA dehydrogenase family protein n=1 Tax=Piscinibacter sp. TaxID=1903157 RepID=UPI001D240F8C|nr:acyl-CoA dehydrogenase family protein [Piscinibacter sp.]MBK7529158.1 acyl-CoA dehydrogenase family protein [Piscinibacter sp.]HNW63958.1 acyl-CoA dehydrogenase family protein [Piscinibacter sp.]